MSAGGRSPSGRRSVIEDVGPDESAGQVASASKHSSCASSIGVRRLELAARKAALEAEAALAEERRKLELEELLLRQRREQLDLKTRLTSLDAEKGVYDSAEESPDAVEVDEKLEEGSGEVILNPRVTSSKGLQPQLAAVGAESQLTSLIEEMRLPSVQLTSFNGDPLQYWPFIRAFDNNIEKCSIDSASKLTRLIYYCNGPARKVIECCAVMPPEAGYARAREILKDVSVMISGSFRHG